jgi:hypothetical protein
MEIGQTVFVKKVGNAARNRSDNDLIDSDTITKIGNKYFYLSKYNWCKFSIEQMRDISDYSSNYLIYLTEQAILDEQELHDKSRDISKHFEYGNTKLPLEAIRQIFNIVYTYLPKVNQ